MAATLTAQAKRLTATRKALGFAAQVGFCREIGVERSIYNPFEKGRRRITIDVALRIKRRFAIPLDWTIDGDPAGLPAHIYLKLGALDA